MCIYTTEEVCAKLLTSTSSRGNGILKKPVKVHAEVIEVSSDEDEDSASDRLVKIEQRSSALMSLLAILSSAFVKPCDKQNR